MEANSVNKTLKSVRQEIENNGQGVAWELEYFDNHQRRYRETIKLIQANSTGKKIALFGSVPGHLALTLSKLGYSVTTVDIAADRLSTVVTTDIEKSVEADIERETLPINTDQFDCVVLAEVFEHLRFNPLHALREANRVLRTDGQLILTTPNLYHLDRVKQFLGFTDGVMWGSPADSFSTLEERGHMGHVRVHSLSEVTDTLEYTGFEIEDTMYRMMEWDHYTSNQSESITTRLKFATARLITTFVKRFRKSIVVVATPSRD